MMASLRLAHNPIPFNVLVFLSGVVTAIAVLPVWERLTKTTSNAPVAAPEFTLLEKQSLVESLGTHSTSFAGILIVVALILVSVPLGMMVVRFAGSKTAGSTTTSKTAISKSAESIRKTKEHLAASSEKADKELTDILRIVGTYAGAGDRYKEALTKNNNKLGRNIRPDQVKQVVRSLISDNQNFLNDTKRLSESLEDSKKKIEELRANLTEAQEEMFRDALTSISNRRHFDTILKREAADADKNPEPLSVVMADFDHFKKINDNFGHQIGDEILKLFAQLLSKNIRETDTAARYGGEEFALIMPQTDTKNALIVAERIRRQLETKTFTIRKTGEQVPKMTASFGIATYRRGEGGAQLVERADAKLYEAKQAGRNQTMI